MKKLFGLSLVVVLTVFLAFGSALAANAKVSALYGDVSLVPADGEWHPIFTQTIRTPNNWEAFIDVSLECGLTTDTTVISKQLAKAIAEAEAVVEIQVWVDDELAAPGQIIFARRHQTLIAKFAGDISGALSIGTDPDGNPIIVIDPELIEPEMLQLILDTMSANSFNFIAPNLTVGDHEIVVEAKLSYITSTEGTEVELGAEAKAAATAYLGKGSVTIEEVRMIKGPDPVADFTP